MPDEDSLSTKARRTPWNKGKLIGAKPPLRPNQVGSIRTRLLIERRTRDLALLHLAIDSKLRGCDVVALRVEDVAPNGYAIARATVRQKKTGRPVRFELTEQTRQAVDAYLKVAGKKPGEFLFTSRRRPGEGMTTRQHARLVSEWIAGVGLDPHVFGTHSLRRTKATLIYRRTGNLRASRQLRTSTVRASRLRSSTRTNAIPGSGRASNSRFPSTTPCITIFCATTWPSTDSIPRRTCSCASFRRPRWWRICARTTSTAFWRPTAFANARSTTGSAFSTSCPRRSGMGIPVV